MAQVGWTPYAVAGKGRKKYLGWCLVSPRRYDYRTGFPNPSEAIVRNVNTHNTQSADRNEQWPYLCRARYRFTFTKNTMRDDARWRWWRWRWQAVCCANTMVAAVRNGVREKQLYVCCRLEEFSHVPFCCFVLNYSMGRRLCFLLRLVSCSICRHACERVSACVRAFQNNSKKYIQNMRVRQTFCK